MVHGSDTRSVDTGLSARGGNAGVKGAYARLAPIYDVLCGPLLYPGRSRAVDRLRSLEGTDVLDVGVGTGLNATLFPDDYAVVGIDISGAMLARAARRLTARGIRNVRLVEMDAAALTFADASFDIVYSSYAITSVPDPIAVVREMHRVCRPDGHVVLLGHFLSDVGILKGVERAFSSVAPSFGFRSDLPLGSLLRDVNLRPVSHERVNIPPLWSLVVCSKG